MYKIVEGWKWLFMNINVWSLAHDPIGHQCRLFSDKIRRWEIKAYREICLWKDPLLPQSWTFSFCGPLLCYAKSLQSCPTLCDPIDGSPTGSPIPGILHARTLEWLAISWLSIMNEYMNKHWKGRKKETHFKFCLQLEISPSVNLFVFAG